MTMALRSKNKLHFINGSLSRPLDKDHDYIESEIAWSLLWMDTATNIWNELRDHFYQGDVLRISDIREAICNLKQGDSFISSYYTKLKKLWQELDNFCPIPECSCNITCQVVIKIRAYKDGD